MVASYNSCTVQVSDRIEHLFVEHQFDRGGSGRPSGGLRTSARWGGVLGGGGCPCILLHDHAVEHLFVHKFTTAFRSSWEGFGVSVSTIVGIVDPEASGFRQKQPLSRGNALFRMEIWGDAITYTKRMFALCKYFGAIVTSS